MYSIQPDWTLSSDYYKKRVVNRLGIAHFYEFRINNLNAASLPSVPDDCVDVVFDLGDESAIAAGTVFERGVTWMVTGHTYFGMRFLPGVKPVILQGNFREYDYHQIDLSLCSIDRFIWEKYVSLAISMNGVIFSWTIIRVCLRGSHLIPPLYRILFGQY